MTQQLFLKPETVGPKIAMDYMEINYTTVDIYFKIVTQWLHVINED